VGGPGLVFEQFKFPAGVVILAQREETDRELVAGGVQAGLDL
jgi:hypothetical protein